MTTMIAKSYNHFPALTDGLSAYLGAIGKIPILSEEEEQHLAKRLREHNDREAARILVISNLRLVVSIAKGYGGYGLELTDLIQEGNIGLMKAVRTFDPTRGARLATFATYWIRAEIHEFILRNWRLVKIVTTKAQRKLFFNMRRLTQSVASRFKDNIKIANELNVKPEEVEDMRARLHNTNMAVLSGEDDDTPTADAYLAARDETSNPETMLEERLKRRVIDEALSSVSERERDIFTARRLSVPAKTLQELATRYDVSVERVRQIEAATFKKITSTIKRKLSPVVPPTAAAV